MGARSFHLIAIACIALQSACTTQPSSPAAATATIDRLVERGMAETGVRGLAIAYIDAGQTRFVRTYGVRNAAGDPLTPDTIMYGASLTKAVVGYSVMQLVDAGRIDLDRSIADVLPQPLPEYNSAADEDAYAGWGALAGDERWRRLTPRMLLTHSSGFSNFGFLEPDGKLKFHFDPGTRYAYSGDGMMLLQFVLERGLQINFGPYVQQQVFDRFGMACTSLKWRADFAVDLADGFAQDGSVEPHDERSRVRAAGSMDTTITDFSRFAAGFVRGNGLSGAARQEIVRGQLRITTPTQFPSLQPLPAQPVFPTLSAGLGLITFEGPQGKGFFKGGHNDTTANTWVCLERRQRCVVILSNDVRAEALFPELVRSLLGETGLPWRWEYGELPFWGTGGRY